MDPLIEIPNAAYVPIQSFDTNTNQYKLPLSSQRIIIKNTKK